MTPRLLPLAAAVLIGAAMAVPASAAVLQPDKLVILSTTDVKGKAIPCGCSTPKGGFSRRASFADSIKAEYGQVLLVDNGGLMPESEREFEYGAFQFDMLRTLGAGAVGLSDRDLRFGLAYLQSLQKQSGLPVISSNLVMKGSKKPAFTPSTVIKVGDVKVGLFGLVSPQGDLGPARDSLEVLDPAETARKTIAELRKKGAHAVVLLSQLGKVETEDLLVAVDGIDATIVGRNVPLLQKGRLIKDTVALYGGEQGHYIGRTLLTFDAKRKVVTRDAETYILSAAVGEKQEVHDVVKAFEDAFARKKREADATNPAAPAADPHAGHGH